MESRHDMHMYRPHPCPLAHPVCVLQLRFAAVMHIVEEDAQDLCRQFDVLLPGLSSQSDRDELKRSARGEELLRLGRIEGVSEVPGGTKFRVRSFRTEKNAAGGRVAVFYTVTIRDNEDESDSCTCMCTPRPLVPLHVQVACTGALTRHAGHTFREDFSASISLHASCTRVAALPCHQGICGAG